MLLGNDLSEIYSEYAASKTITALFFRAYSTKTRNFLFVATAPVGLLGLQIKIKSTLPFGGLGINPSSSLHSIYTTFFPEITLLSRYTGYTGSATATILSVPKMEEIFAESDFAPSLTKISCVSRKIPLFL